MKLGEIINSIIKDKQDNVYRIIDIDYNNDIIVIINTNENSMPKVRNLNEVLLDINSGEVELIIDDTYNTIINEEQLSDNDRKYRDKAYSIVSSMLNDSSFTLGNSKQLSRYIKYTAEEYSISEKTVKRYLIRYLVRGQTKNALLPDHYKCGGKGKEKKLGIAKIGLPRKYDKKSGNGVNVTGDIKKVFKKSIDTIYFKEGNKTLSTTYEIMISRYFRDDNGNIIDKNSIPTLPQFRYWYKNYRNIKKEISSRDGEKEYYLNVRPVLGTSGQDAEYPTALFQIDSTQGDVHLVSSYNRNDVIGRPTIYIIIDVFSRMVTGFYAGLENASWSCVMMAFHNCTVDKVEFCKQYGIDINENEWNASQLPEAILADRGTELTGKNIETLSNSFGVDVKNTAPYRADLKGIVERFFRTLNSQFKEFIPGSIKSNIKKRGQKDSREFASLTIYEINRIIIKCILNHNNSYMKTYKRDEVMIEENVHCIPTEIWEWGMKNRVGYRSKISDDIIKLNLMPSAKATVTKRGIKFKNIYYICDTAIEKQWFERANLYKSWKIDIRYDPRNMNYIYIIKNKGRDYEICRLKDSESRYLDKSLDEIEYLNKLELELNAQSDYKNLLNNIDKNDFIESEVERSLNREEESIKKKKNISEIRENRKIEKNHNRKSEAFCLASNIAERILDDHIEESNSCVIDDIKIGYNEEIKVSDYKEGRQNRKESLKEKLKRFQEENLYK